MKYGSGVEGEILIIVPYSYCRPDFSHNFKLDTDMR